MWTLSQALPANLVELHLALNEVTAEGAGALGAALGRLARLQVLNLRENELENDGAASLAQPISRLRSLRQLDLAQNQVRPPAQPCRHLLACACMHAPCSYLSEPGQCSPHVLGGRHRMGAMQAGDHWALLPRVWIF